ncbi:DUF6263 family protein [Aureisphaera galaxeae]|uniref:DUF6263 family protein n=1 Tax=Aureisphaera galaxeae TaxID=1538023 RepID=UPI002350A9A6|nr:DUF6263 family protein [Aureisphaera galaxeae]MDC8003640.1 DUF6263 family protein [Aureisphaera galaxeae]
MKRLIYLCAFFLFLSGIGATAQNSLQYNFKVGDEFDMEQTARQEMIQNIEGMTNTTVNVLSGSFNFKVIEATEEKYVIATAYTSLVLKSESDMIGVLMDIDTKRDADKDDIEAQIFQGLINIPFQIHMLKTGEIVSLENSSALIDGMISRSGLEDEASKEMMRQSLESEFGDDSLAESMEQLLYLYPNKPVHVGDTWINAYTGEFKANNTWKLDNYASDAFSLSATSTISLSTDVQEGVRLSLDGDQESSVSIETGTGFPKEMSVNQTAKGATVINGTEYPTTLTSTITYKRI